LLFGFAKVDHAFAGYLTFYGGVKIYECPCFVGG